MHSRGARFGAPASAAEAQLRRRPPGEIVSIVLQVIVVGALAALFFAWLGGGLSADAGCEYLGKGGVRCPQLAVGHAASDGTAGCVSAGRGGLVCAR